MRLTRVLLLCFGSFAVAAVASAQDRTADLVVINAKIRTLVSRTSVAEALAVKRDTITAVTTNGKIKRFIGPRTRVIDARGQLLIPGFNDAHVHFLSIGNTFSSLDLRDARSASDIAAKIARFSAFLPDGRWILGGNFTNETSDLPNRRMLDNVAPTNPVFLYNAEGKAALANGLAFELAGVKVGTEGVERAADGEPTGIVSGFALRKIAAQVPSNHTRNWLEIAETATNYAASLGVTSVQDMHSDDSREIYLHLARQGMLKTRVYDCLPLSGWRRLSQTRLAPVRGAMVTDGCLKSFSDGDEDSKLKLLSDVIQADRTRLQIMIHAIGEGANRIALDVFEETARINGPFDRRFRVEHAHKVSGEDLPRFNRALIIASMQPYLFSGSAESRYGTMLDRHVRVAFGSDASMVDFSPLMGIQAATSGGAESVSVYEAVRAYTLGAAYAEFQEKSKGTIEVGKLADFVILSDDIFTDSRTIRSTNVVFTVVGGQIVYSASHSDRHRVNAPRD